jgi:hypothetical protein
MSTKNYVQNAWLWQLRFLKRRQAPGTQGFLACSTKLVSSGLTRLCAPRIRYTEVPATNKIGLLTICARNSSGNVTQIAAMASSHSRNASTADRRSVNAGITSRAASVRAREHEKPFVRDDGSPIMSENSANNGNADRVFDKSSDFERRTERTFTTTKEKTVRTRSPVKESASAGNRREPDRARRNIPSPVEKKKAKELEHGMPRV